MDSIGLSAAQAVVWHLIAFSAGESVKSRPRDESQRERSRHPHGYIWRMGVGRGLLLSVYPMLVGNIMCEVWD